jgi:hypothetical protein
VKEERGALKRKENGFSTHLAAGMVSCYLVHVAVTTSLVNAPAEVNKI